MTHCIIDIFTNVYCRVIVMMSIVMASVVTLNVIMMSVVMLNVVAPMKPRANCKKTGDAVFVHKRVDYLKLPHSRHFWPTYFTC